MSPQPHEPARGLGAVLLLLAALLPATLRAQAAADSPPAAPQPPARRALTPAQRSQLEALVKEAQPRLAPLLEARRKLEAAAASRAKANAEVDRLFEQLKALSQREAAAKAGSPQAQPLSPQEQADLRSLYLRWEQLSQRQAATRAQVAEPLQQFHKAWEEATQPPGGR